MNLCKDCKYVDKNTYVMENWKCLAPENLTRNFLTGELTPIRIFCENIRKSPNCTMFVYKKETTHDFYKDSHVTTS